MKAPTLEFSRPLKVDRVPAEGSAETLSADSAECAALARRLGIPALHALSAQLRASPWRGGGLKIEGRLKADLEQISVVSLTQFRSTVEFPVERFFLSEAAASSAEDEDVDTIADGHVDLGEVVAETLALELDPYPRQEGETFAHPEEADNGDSPFAALSRLRRK